jgi:P-type E1-E2 ATPase
MLIKIATSFTSLSTHPVSNAITTFGQDNKIDTFEPDSFKTITGKGIIGSIGNQKIILGNAALLKEESIIFNENKSAYSKLYLAIDGIYQGVFLVSDQIKPGVDNFLFEFVNKYNVIVLSGDNLEVCNDLALKLGLKKIISNMSPEGKRDYILDLKKNGHTIAMVGDGINDSLALASADLSIAMGNGSDLAVSTSKVSLSDGNILALDKLLNSSKETVKIIRENLFFSFVYNFSMIPIAAGFFKSYGLSLNPKYASLLMGISSLSIFINSLRLKKL